MYYVIFKDRVFRSHLARLSRFARALCCRDTQCWDMDGIGLPWNCTFGFEVCLPVTDGVVMSTQTWYIEADVWFEVPSWSSVT